MLPGDISTSFVCNYVFSMLKQCQPFIPVEDTVFDMITKGVRERRKRTQFWNWAGTEQDA